MIEPIPIFPKISYLALGDSYTIGEGVSHSERWPDQLVHALRHSGYTIDDPEIIAQTGWNTAELQAGIGQMNLQDSYTLVSLLIGVNNQYRDDDFNRFQSEFKSLLKTAIKFAQNHSDRVFVLSIPDWGVTPFAAGKDRAKIGREIDHYNANNHNVSIEYGVQYIDITGLSRKAALKPDLLASDGLHPSGKMYQLWVKKIMPSVDQILMKITKY